MHLKVNPLNKRNYATVADILYFLQMAPVVRDDLRIFKFCSLICNISKTSKRFILFNSYPWIHYSI